MNKEKTLREITFLLKILDTFDVNNVFKKITIYGSNEYPLFPLENIAEVLNISLLEINNNVKKFEKDEIFENGQFKNKKDITMLTKYGLYHILFTTENKQAKKFREFIYMML